MSKFESRRQEIVDIAARLFALQGYEATSISHLSDAVGLGRGALYHYIGSKEALLSEIGDRFMIPLLERGREIESLDLSGAEKLVRLSEVMLDIQYQLHDHSVVVLTEYRELVGPEFEGFNKRQEDFERIVGDTLQLGLRDGSLMFEDALSARRAFLGIHTSTVSWLDPAGRLSARELSRLYCDMFLHGIANRSAPR